MDAVIHDRDLPFTCICKICPHAFCDFSVFFAKPSRLQIQPFLIYPGPVFHPGRCDQTKSDLTVRNCRLCHDLLKEILHSLCGIFCCKLSFLKKIVCSKHDPQLYRSIHILPVSQLFTGKSNLTSCMRNTSSADSVILDLPVCFPLQNFCPAVFFWIAVSCHHTWIITISIRISITDNCP